MLFPSVSSKTTARAWRRVQTPRDSFPAAAMPPIGYPGMGVRSTFAAPTWKCRAGTGFSGIGSDPEMDAQDVRRKIRSE